MERYSSHRNAAPVRKFYAWLASALRASGRTPDLIMDVGCGTGTLSVGLRRPFPRARLELSDPSDAMASRARDRFRDDPLVRVRRDTARSALARMRPGSVDAVVFCRSWFTFEDHEATASEVLRVLRPDGYCFLLDFQRIPTRDEIHVTFGREHHAGHAAATAFGKAVRNGRYRLHSRRSLRTLWSNAGAVVEHCEAMSDGRALRAAMRKTKRSRSNLKEGSRHA